MQSIDVIDRVFIIGIRDMTTGLTTSETHNNIPRTQNSEDLFKTYLLQHCQDHPNISLKLSINGHGNIRKATKRMRLDRFVQVLSLQQLQQSPHDLITISVDLWPHRAAHVANTSNGDRTKLVLLIILEAGDDELGDEG
jgi:hypothetical protein